MAWTVDLANSNGWFPWQPSKINMRYCFHSHDLMDFDSNNVSDDEGQGLFAAFQLFGSSKRASIRKPLLTSLKRGLLRRIPKTNLKRILQRMMEAMVKTCTGLRHPSIPSGGVSPIVYVYPWNLAHPRLKISAPLQRSTPATTPNDSKKGVSLVQRVERQLNLGNGTIESDRKFSAT